MILFGIILSLGYACVVHGDGKAEFKVDENYQVAVINPNKIVDMQCGEFRDLKIKLQNKGKDFEASLAVDRGCGCSTNFTFEPKIVGNNDYFFLNYAYDSSGRSEGLYDMNLAIFTNDKKVLQFSIPINFSKEISISPKSFDLGDVPCKETIEINMDILTPIRIPDGNIQISLNDKTKPKFTVVESINRSDTNMNDYREFFTYNITTNITAPNEPSKFEDKVTICISDFKGKGKRFFKVPIKGRSVSPFKITPEQLFLGVVDKNDERVSVIKIESRDKRHIDITNVSIEGCEKINYEIKKNAQNQSEVKFFFKFDKSDKKVNRFPIKIEISSGDDRADLTIPCLYILS